MTIEEIKALDMDGVEARVAEIRGELKTDGADLDALTAEVDALEARKVELEDAANKAAELRKRVAAGEIGTVIESHKEVETMPEKRTLAEVRSSAEYADAYADYIKTKSDKECRAVLSELATDGTVPVPTILEGYIERAWEDAELFGLTSQIEMAGIVRIPVEAATGSAAVHTEGGSAVDEMTVTLEDVLLTPESLMAWITVTGEVMALNGVQFLTYIGQLINQKLSELIDEKVVAAITGSSYTQTASLDETWQGLLSAQALLSSAASNPVIVCTKADLFNNFLQQVDSANRPIYNVISENGKPSYIINGVRAYTSEALTDGTYIVGDFRGVTCNTPIGKTASYVTDPYSLATEDKTVITGKIYLAAEVTKLKHFVVATAAATE